LTRLEQVYNEFPKIEQGGPLLFALLMQMILITNESSIKTLHDQLKKYKIKQIPNENIKTASSIILSVSTRIWHSREQTFPDNFIDDVLKIYQTTSCSFFNEHFKKAATDRTNDIARFNMAKMRGQPLPVLAYSNDLDSVTLICALGDQLYDAYTLDGTWSKSIKNLPSHTPSGSALNSTTVSCFNCGSKEHSFQNCPEPRDNARIKRARENFQNRKASGSSSKPTNSGKSDSRTRSRGADQSKQANGTKPSNNNTNRFRPPDNPSETSRFITTKALGIRNYKWNPATKRWEVQGDTSALNTGSTPPVAPTTDAEKRTAIANLQRQLELLNAQL
jgi:hypothetical protein